MNDRMMAVRIRMGAFALATCSLALGATPFKAVPDATVRGYFDRFTADDDEQYRETIPNGEATAWALDAIPRFVCPDADIERTYYFRWWTYRKHLRKGQDGRWVVTEFMPNVGYAGVENTISCPFNHHVNEGRWLREPAYVRDYIAVMMQKGKPRSYVCAPAWGAWAFACATGEWTSEQALLDLFVKNYEACEPQGKRWGLSLADPRVSCRVPIKGVDVRTGFNAESGLFEMAGNYEGSEFALSVDGARPLVNAFMWADATAIARLVRRAGNAVCAERFEAKAAALEKAIKATLWNPKKLFFTARAADGAQDDVCELNGYAPFAVGMPLAGFGAAWAGVLDEKGFLAPKGLVFPRRDTPGFQAGLDRAQHPCMWNGPSWPYATSVALTGLANALRAHVAGPATREDFARLVGLYARQHVRMREDGRVVPWIDENLSGFTGEWLARARRLPPNGKTPKGFRETGKDYNHSTFCDLVISGLCGVVPQADGQLKVEPLAPAAWDWWCLDGVRYHGRDVTILYDRDGTHFNCGKGLVIR